MKLENACAIVTGGASSLGYAIAERLAREGANVVVADVAGSAEAARRLGALGPEPLGIDTDVSDETAVQFMVDQAERRFGRIDVLVNNAAISRGVVLKPFEELELADWQGMLAVNTIGPFLCCRAVSPHMRKRKAGRIINMTSGTAFKGAPQMLHYVASKGALMSMTRSLARELGMDNITVNAISPGYTLTEGNLSNPDFMAAQRGLAIASRALPRDAYSEDLVGAVAFLAGPDAAFISGQILAVDGGSVYH